MSARSLVARRVRGERGSLSVELAMIAPGLLFIFALIFAYGRVGQVNGTLESGTRDGARSASLARSYDEAETRAKAAVQEAITGTPKRCQDSLSVKLTGDFEPGAQITVTSTCSYGLSDIGLPGAPGNLSPVSRFTSTLDPNRGIE